MVWWSDHISPIQSVYMVRIIYLSSHSFYTFYKSRAFDHWIYSNENDSKYDNEEKERWRRHVFTIPVSNFIRFQWWQRIYEIAAQNRDKGEQISYIFFFFSVQNKISAVNENGFNFQRCRVELRACSICVLWSATNTHHILNTRLWFASISFFFLRFILRTFK